jgi:hypothetical protein
MRSAGGGSAERRRDEHGTVPPLETGLTRSARILTLPDRGGRTPSPFVSRRSLARNRSEQTRLRNVFGCQTPTSPFPAASIIRHDPARRASIRSTSSGSLRKRSALD